jgi:hypothetical protein
VSVELKNGKKSFGSQFWWLSTGTNTEQIKLSLAGIADPQWLLQVVVLVPTPHAHFVHNFAPISTTLFKFLTTSQAMGGQIKVRNTNSDDENEEDYKEDDENEEDYKEDDENEEDYEEDDGGLFSCSYSGLEDLRGIFIRSAIGYLEALSAKNLSRAVLNDAGILDADAAANEDEVVLITNYRLRIDAALKLLRSWCREKTGDGTSNLFRSDKNLDIKELLARHNRRFEMPIDDCILPPGMTQGMMGVLEDMNSNYRIDRIPKTLPPVLRELNLQILHRFLSHSGELNYEEAQKFILFLDKTKPFLEFDEYWHNPSKVVEEIRAVFASCKPIGKVHIG